MDEKAQLTETTDERPDSEPASGSSDCYTPSRKHEGCRRQFSHLSRAWYGAANLARTRDVIDEIMVGMYHEDGGTTGEFAIRWTELSGKHVPMLVVYDDAWDALLEFRDVLEGLKQIDGQNATPEAIGELLKACGVEEATEEESPYGEPLPSGMYAKSCCSV